MTSERHRRALIPISRPQFDETELELLAEVMNSGWVTQGPKVRAFEEAFAAEHGVRHAIAVTSCTTGLHLVLAALGVGPGDEVIVPAFTWISTANVVLHCGATPVLADVDPVTFNVPPEEIRARLTARTRAVIPVHLFGLYADMDAIKAVVPDGVWIVEDAACAAGARYRGRCAGSLGHFGVFSFHPRKIITTGEGGMITTDDSVAAERIDRMRNHGALISEEIRHHGPKPYSLTEFHELGYNYRMTDLQGAVGVRQVAKLRRFVDERAALAERYRRELADLDWLRLPHVPDGWEHGWQAYVTYVDPDKAPSPRNRIMEILQDDWRISCRPGTHAVHTLHYYQERFGLGLDDYPGARACHDNSMALPLYNGMTDADVDRIVAALHSL